MRCFVVGRSCCNQPDPLLDYVATHLSEYTPAEYESLFRVHCPERTVVDEEHLSRLHKLLANDSGSVTMQQQRSRLAG